MDITIVGGGAIGLGIAWLAARQGWSVTVVDPEPGRGASWAAAGMLAPVTETHFGEEALTGLNLASSRRWPDFATELVDAAGIDPGYRRCGGLSVARDLDDQAALAELHAYQQRLGLSVRRLSAAETRAAEPALSPRIRGGLLASDDHQVDNRAFVSALLVACERAGVVFERATVSALDCDDRVRAVVLHDGRQLGGDAVVIAAGVGSSRLGGVPPDVLPPLRAVKGQLLHLGGPVEACPSQGIVRGLEVYVVSRGDGRVVVGATMEERDDTTVTAGAVMELLRAAWELLPGIAELELVETTAGLRPATPDNAPVIGPSALPGLHLATGHFRNGVLQTPVTAEAIVAGLRGEQFPETRHFPPTRFHLAEAAT